MRSVFVPDNICLHHRWARAFTLTRQDMSFMRSLESTAAMSFVSSPVIMFKELCSTWEVGVGRGT